MQRAWKEKTDPVCTFCGNKIRQPRLKITLDKGQTPIEVEFMCAEKLYASVIDMCLRESNSSRKAGDQVSLVYLRSQKE